MYLMYKLNILQEAINLLIMLNSNEQIRLLLGWLDQLERTGWKSIHEEEGEEYT